MIMEGLFDFEVDGRYPLRRIPMQIRFNLDACGVKLTLIGWTLLSHEQRETLLALPCETAQERIAYRERILSMLKPHADNPEAVPEIVDVETTPIWRETQAVPAQVAEQLIDLALRVPDALQWQALNDLQRFAICKLTRSGHKNANLSLALKEFGLL